MIDPSKGIKAIIADHGHCGPGWDTVFTGHKRPKLRNCENVVNRCTTKRRGTLR